VAKIGERFHLHDCQFEIFVAQRIGRRDEPFLKQRAGRRFFLLAVAPLKLSPEQSELARVTASRSRE